MNAATDYDDMLISLLHDGNGFEDIAVTHGSVAEAHARDLVRYARRDGWIDLIYPKVTA